MIARRRNILRAENWEALGDNVGGYTFVNDTDGNLVITATGTSGNSGVFLKTGILPARADGTYRCTIRYQTWGTGADQPRCGIGARYVTGPDYLLLCLARTVGDAFQVRGREADNSSFSTVGSNATIGSGAGYDGVFYDLEFVLASTSLSGTAQRTNTSDSPTAWSGTATLTGAGQTGIAWNGFATSQVVTVSKFEIVA